MKYVIKRFIIPFIFLLLFTYSLFYVDTWGSILSTYITKSPKITIPVSNEYVTKQSFQFVKETDNFIPLSKEDIKNIFYTIVNHGWKSFTFYCPSEYTNCLNDVKSISQDQDLLTHLNNFVHPYNGFSNVKTTLSESGDITIDVTYFYTDTEITQINQKVDELYKELITDNMSTYDKIMTIHDYIINHSKYDVTRNNNGDSSYHSYIAYGPLFEGYATCNGYTDAMALFLDKMGVPNFKVAMTPADDDPSTEGHVWNAVYINNSWLHLDLTWDDPVSTDGKDYLQHKYFLITTKQLKEADSTGEVKVTEHQFKENIYLELKEQS